MATAKAALPNPTFFNSAVSNSATITIPANAPPHSAAILVDVVQNSIGAGTPVTPSGWINDQNVLSSSENYRLMISHRLLNADDEGDVVTGMDETRDSKIMVVFEGPFRGVAMKDFDQEITSGNPSAQTVSAAAGRRPLAVMGISVDVAGVASFSTFSPAADAEIAVGNGDMRLGYKVYGLAALPADHTIDQNDLGAINWLASWYYEFW